LGSVNLDHYNFKSLSMTLKPTTPVAAALPAPAPAKEAKHKTKAVEKKDAA
jgi:hypothetical protein